MRLYSTAESVYNNEISLLAIAETVVATAAVIYLSVRFNSLKWIAWTAFIAPFLLLRTDHSTEFGIKVIEKYFGWYLVKMAQSPEANPDQPLSLKFFRALKSLLFPLFYPLVTSIVGYFVRLIAVPVTVCRHPLLSFSSIPDNWIRATLSVDTHCPPEIVPGYEVKGTKASLKLSSWFLPNLLNTLRFGNFRRKVFVLIFYIPALILFFGPPLFYRWSLKATAIVYTPFVWIARSTFRKMPDIKAALTRIRKSDLTRIVVLYSSLVTIGFAVKFILMMKWNNFAAWWNATPLTEFLSIYVVPAEIPPWQLAAFINALWAIGLFFFAGEALLHIETREPWSTRFVESTLRISSFGRWVLTLYTVACAVYLTIQASWSWHLPKLGTKIFPWW